ncbi:MAG: DUF58 domain-containing protein [Acidobacteriota bacterium]
MIPAEVRKAIRRIEIQTKRLVNQGLGGEYHSVFKGRGMEFSEVREYQEGDDVRHVDWNVTSRTGQLHVKKFVEERELTVLLLVDVSRSGDFGSGRDTKLERAAKVAAVLALSAVRNNDRVGLLLFTDRVEAQLHPAKGHQHVLRVVREVLCHEPQGTGTDIATALETACRLERKRSITCVISDFQDDGYDKALKVAARAHDVVAVCVDDRREADWPALGLVEVEDAETGERQLIDLSDSRQRRWLKKRRESFEHERREGFRRAGVDVLEIDTVEPYDRPILQFFKMRERKARAGA